MYYSTLLLLPAVLAANIDVLVGKGGQVYNPDKVTASAGDTVTFHWSNPFHSVSQTTFDKPCAYKDGGINSGVISTTTPTFVVSIKNSDPIWIYCSVGQHCQSGMLMVINEPSGMTLDALKNSAATVSSTTPPTAVMGGTLNQSGGSSGGSSSMSSAASMSSSSMASSMASMASMASMSGSMSSMSSSMASAAATMTTTSMSSSTSSGAQSSTSIVTASKAAAMHHAGDAVMALGAAAVAILL